MRSLADHLRSPTLGEPPDVRDGSSPAGFVEGAAGGSCGVVARFWLTVDDGGIVRTCAARVRGRAAAFAAASALCEAAPGRSIVDAASLGLGTLHETFAGMEEDDRERALVVEDAFHHALGRWALRQMRAAPEGVGDHRPRLAAALAPADQITALVGMSGGVDSAVALHRTLERPGVRAAGATLRLWIDPLAPDPEAACCSPDSVRRARATCHAAGVPHLSIDLREAFAREVVVPFVGAYAAGATPNPCVTCNGRFRLDELVRLADVVGADDVVTGHYARIVEREGVPLIARGADPAKDQSYMLAAVAPATAARLRFPLGAMHKIEVRHEAAERGLAQATAPESQEVCFLGGGDYRAFLERSEALGRPGEILLDQGDGSAPAPVATHDGIARFTPGQRRGIGIAAPTPLYVLDVDGDSGRVLVGSAERLQRREVALGELRWHHPSPPRLVRAQLRYRSRGGGAAAEVLAAGEQGVDARLRFDEPQRAPAPGQSAVLYDEGGAVLGTGLILREPAVADASSAR